MQTSNSEQEPTTQQYQAVARAIDYIYQQRQQQPTLNDIAAAIDLSPHYTQRLFQVWAGLSPRAFLQFLTRHDCLQRLRAGEDILSASLAAGLSSPSRLHDLCLHWDAMTPGSYKRQGQGLTIIYSWQETPIGQALIASTEHGLCYVDFSETDQGEKELRARWPQADFLHTPQQHQGIGQQLFTPHPQLNLHIIGTPFQHKVWEALLRISPGQVSSYGGLAKAIGQPKASRAVGTAVAQNPLGLLIPCHRVIRRTGDIGDYHWGQTRKACLLLREQA